MATTQETGKVARAGDKLEGRVALVTGASSGLGLRFAELLAGEGAAVALVARRADRLAAVKARINEGGGRAVAIAADVTDRRGMMRAFDEAEKAFGTITSQFQEKESNFWNSPLQIVAFGNIHEVAFRPWQSDNIPRRFCSAVAVVSDGTRHPVHYWIGEDTGFAGATWGVEWCVTGLDRNWAYNPACRMARP